MSSCPSGTSRTPSTVVSSTFTILVPLHILCLPFPLDPSPLICVDLVLPMGWVNSPDYLCSASETVADITNRYLLDPSSTFTVYPPTSSSYHTTTSSTASSSRLQYVDIYTDDLLCLVQGDPLQQTWVAKFSIRAIKEIFPCTPSEVKDSVS